MSDVREWLESIGLGQYAEAFEHNAIDWKLLPKLDQEILKDIGVQAAGHRIRILDAAKRVVLAESSGESSGPTGDAERRHLTVMFCDLVGSTELSERFDPEDYRELLTAYQSTAVNAIQAYEGYIARYMGDGLLAYFGYPQAHEDDPERAVRAGLEVVESVRALRPAHGEPLQVRIGISTGLVLAGDIVGEGASEEHAVLGETPNLAARLQTIAAPNSVLVSKSTQRLVAERFEMDFLGEHPMKGFSSPASAYRVRAVRSGTRFEIATVRGLSPLVGREEEVGLLLARWRQACSGEGQVVVLSGEPGIGKSRLTQALLERASAERPSVLRYQCSPYHTNSAYFPIVEEIERSAQIGRHDSPEEKWLKLERMHASRESAAEVELAYFAALLSLPTDRVAELDVTPRKQKAETISALIRRYRAAARARPLIIVFEDVHWIDPTTLDLLSALVEAIRNLTVFVVITGRPEFASPWTRQEHVTHHSLNRLSRTDVTALIEAVNTSSPLPPSLIRRIVERTDGVALYVEELTKSLLESMAAQQNAFGEPNAPAMPALMVPDSLQDSLMARLDRLGGAKQTAQAGAVLGREFSRDALAAITPTTEAALDGNLDTLVRTGLLTCRDNEIDVIYSFKHALVQDAAYNSLLISKRQYLHRLAAEHLSTEGVAVAPAPEVLAYHYSNAEAPYRAAQMWCEAAELAISRSANSEALAHIERGIQELERLPRHKERDSLELRLRVLLGNALSAAYGYADTRIGDAYGAARALCLALEDDEELALVLRGQHVHELTIGRTERAREAAEELARLVEKRNLDDIRIGVQHNLSQIYFLLGDPVRALTEGEEGARLRETAQHARWAGGDPRVQCHVWAAAAAALLGDDDCTVAHTNSALRISERNPRLFSRVHAIALLCIPAVIRGEETALIERSARAVEISSEFDIPYWRAWARFVNAWARSTCEDRASSLDEVLASFDEYMALGASFCSSFFGSLLAERALEAGELDLGLSASERALQIAESTGERWWQPETHRVRGRLLTNSTRYDEAAREFDSGFELAKQQGSRVFADRCQFECNQARSSFEP